MVGVDLKILEDFGIRKIKNYYQLFEKSPKSHYTTVYALFTSPYLYFLTSIAFLIGFSLTVPIIWLELQFDIFNLDTVEFGKIAIYLFVLIVLVTLEFYLLFILGFYTIAYYIYHLKHIEEIESQHLKQTEFLALFARVVMELPEHDTPKHTIEYHQLSNINIATFTVVYKLKVVVSNFFLKFIMKRILVKSSFRVYTPYIATLGTGLWDAIVFYKTIKHSQYKVMVRYTIDYLLLHKKALLLKDVNIRAILNRYYYYGEYSNNLDYLLNQLLQSTNRHFEEESYIDIHVTQTCHHQLLLLIYAFKEKLHTKKERQIIKSINTNKTIERVREALKSGNTKKIREFIDHLPSN